MKAERGSDAWVSFDTVLALENPWLICLINCFSSGPLESFKSEFEEEGADPTTSLTLVGRGGTTILLSSVEGVVEVVVVVVVAEGVLDLVVFAGVVVVVPLDAVAPPTIRASIQSLHSRSEDAMRVYSAVELPFLVTNLKG